MRFDRSSDPTPISAQLAVKRGVALINWPVHLIMLIGFGGAYLLRELLPALSIVLAFAAIPSAWLWWSYFIPQWRNWAHRNGANPVELQELAQYASLVWPKGSFFERTEIHRNGR